MLSLFECVKKNPKESLYFLVVLDRDNFITEFSSFYHFSVKGKGDYIDVKQFVEFLNDKQRDPRLNEILYPYYNEKRASEIIRNYEPIEEFKTHNRLSKDGLIRYLVSILFT